MNPETFANPEKSSLVYTQSQSARELTLEHKRTRRSGERDRTAKPRVEQESGKNFMLAHI